MLYFRQIRESEGGAGAADRSGAGQLRRALLTRHHLPPPGPTLSDILTFIHLILSFHLVLKFSSFSFPVHHLTSFFNFLHFRLPLILDTFLHHFVILVVSSLRLVLLMFFIFRFFLSISHIYFFNPFYASSNGEQSVSRMRSTTRLRRCSAQCSCVRATPTRSTTSPSHSSTKATSTSLPYLTI